MSTDKNKLLCWAAAIYNTQEPKIEGKEAKELKQLAARQLVKYIKWLEKEADKITT